MTECNQDRFELDSVTIVPCPRAGLPELGPEFSAKIPALFRLAFRSPEAHLSPADDG
jgi:hypothetical protein